MVGASPGNAGAMDKYRKASHMEQTSTTGERNNKDMTMVDLLSLSFFRGTKLFGYGLRMVIVDGVCIQLT